MREDREIIDSVLDGDNEAYSELVLRYQDRLLGFCYSMLYRRAEAEDAAQEIFIKAYRSLPDFRGDSSFSTWLYRIAFNHCSSLRKRAAARSTESFDAMTDQRREELLSSPGAVTDAQPCEDMAASAMLALPEAYRAAMAMRLEGEDYKAIADSLGISVDSVKARLRRARIILRDKLRHFLPEGTSNTTEEE